MQRKIDESRFLIRLTQKLSTFLAANRGIPILVGIVLIAIGFVLTLMNHASPASNLDLLSTIFHHAGLLIALVGILLAEPLGK